MRQKHILGMVMVVAFAGIMIGCAETSIPSEESEKIEGEWQSGQAESEAVEKTEDSLQNQQPIEEEDAHHLVIAISPKGEEIEWAIYSEGVYCYGNGSLCGYLSEDGEEITPCIYSEAAPFSEGLACVRLDGKYGYIGKDGETVLPFIYDQASPFSEGVAYFSCGEEYGLMDNEGNVVLKLTDCDSISSFREGLAYFSMDGQYGYMDKNGGIVVEPIYDDAGYFYEGLAVVMKDGFGGVIADDGREILPPEYIGISMEDTCIIAQKEDYFYLFDREGNEVSSGTWDWISGGRDLFYIHQDDKKGFLDKYGNMILEPIYEYIMPIPEKELIIVQNENDEYGIVDYEGQVRLPFCYSTIRYLGDADGLYVVEADTGKAGYLDGEDFSVKIPAVYDSLGRFAEDRAVAKLDGKYGVVRYDGTVDVPFEYDRISLFSDGSMAVWTGEMAELTDRQGNRILAGKYENIEEWGNSYKTGTTKEGYSYWDRQGTLIANSKFGWPDFVYGAENSFILYEGILLRSGEESGERPEEFLLTNHITPNAGLFMEFLRTGAIIEGTEEHEYSREIGELPQGRRFSKLYRMGDENIPVLFFYAEPLARLTSFSESDSGLFTVRDGQVEQLAGANECGGSLRGDWACFWYDTEEKISKPGTSGIWGGWPGYASGGSVYELNGQAVRETSFMYSEDENNVEYSINGEEVSEEVYGAVRGRYRYYLPLDHIKTR